MIQGTTLHVAIPAMNEAESLPRTIDCLLKQTVQEVQIWVCVNQPDAWWNDPLKQPLCENNLHTLDYLNQLDLTNLHVLDHCSPGKGWQGKNAGVGQARKTIMDAIDRVASERDIMVSLDADTLVGKDYLACIQQNLNDHPQAAGISVPYYHQLSGKETLDRAMLRYEIYMRHYAINMWIIGSPYSFTALGSAIALPVSAYRKIGGMTPKKSGEDFYLLQKLRKTGRLINTNPCWVFPGTRFSDRVFFGTGPALIKGSQGNWESYPVYDHQLFLQVKETYNLFPALYNEDLPTPMSDFLQEQFRCENIFQALRVNSRTSAQFVKACHHRIDGLRVLQFLKS
ncbi:MAG: glycosyltransferase family 2 protein, partial [Bacteroidales bacterium]